jgi:hypothetical protein
LDADVKMDAIWVHHINFNNLNKEQKTHTYQPIFNEQPKEMFEEEIEKEMELQQPFITQPIEKMFFETLFQGKIG